VKEKLYHNLLHLKVSYFCLSFNFKKEKISLLEDIKRLKQDKQALEVDLEKMKKERDQAKDQIAYATGKMN
jgi:cell division protein FtsB